jgi:tripartite-type tricarboxylate transporter receptor subunit TctC
MATIAHSVAPGIYKNLPYDFERDFDPIALVASTPNVLIVNNDLPVKSVAELIAYAKANPGKLNFGSAGIGSTEHLSGELFRAMTKTQLTHIPYKGGAPMMADLMGGQIQFAIETSPSAAPHVRGGQVRALAVTTTKRSPAYPELPTLDESGLAGYEVTTWFALMAPHGTPSAVVRRLNDVLAKLLTEPDVTKQFEEQGVSAGKMSGPDLAAFIRSETAKWTKTAKDAGIAPE